MGIYLNPGNAAFRQSVRSKIYVDKTDLIGFTNEVLDSETRYLCVSRPRRFGKSMTAKMLCAYYDRSCDSHDIFDSLHISTSASYSEHLNSSNVLYLDIAWFFTTTGKAELVVPALEKAVIQELRDAYPTSVPSDMTSLPMVLANINNATDEQFVIIIDEWDCLFREAKRDEKAQTAFIELLRGLFKSGPAQRFVRLAYLTGILPIKKYGTQSALNHFHEFTMVAPRLLGGYVGFTEAEVRSLCQRYDMDFNEAKRWYDGYSFPKIGSVYNPSSVVQALIYQEFSNYWTATESYTDLKLYIDMDFDGLRDAIVLMLGGARCKIITRRFQNDMSSIRSKDDVLTLLVHLGYLAFDPQKSEVYIPNQEITDEFENAIEDGGWEEIAHALQASDDLLAATLSGDEEAVAQGIEAVHLANTSVLTYHNELSLSCVITLAYFCARRKYTLIRELPTGKGFADIAFLPYKYSDNPALLVELKWDRSAESAIHQIKSNQYAGVLKNYAGKVLLVGINYDRKTKRHQCVIEEYQK